MVNFIKKAIILSICLVLSFSNLVNPASVNANKLKSTGGSVFIQQQGDTSILSTNDWAEYIAIEYGKRIKIY